MAKEAIHSKLSYWHEQLYFPLKLDIRISLCVRSDVSESMEGHMQIVIDIFWLIFSLP